MVVDMSGETIVLVVACALIDTDGRVLISQRPEGKAMAGLMGVSRRQGRAWRASGNGAHPRAREELGIDVTAACLAPLTFASHGYPSFHLLMPLYVCRRWKGEIRPGEGQRIAWVRPMGLRAYPMPPADIPLVAHLIDAL